jgi:glycine hydroxymethyltransferase
LDFRETEITGKAAQAALESIGLVANKNLVPHDTRSSVQTSGLRIGTPAATTRGMTEPEMQLIAGFIASRLDAMDDDALELRLRGEVLRLVQAYPVPGLREAVPA